MAAEPTGPSGQVSRVRVQIDGEDFAVRGPASDRYMIKLAAYVDARIREVRRDHPNLPRHRAAVLAAFHLADEVHRLKKENAELLELLEDAR